MLNRLKPWLKSPWTAALMALLIRLAVMVYTREWQINPEMDNYNFGFETGRVARSIASGQGFSSPLHGETGPTAWLMPVYPYLLAGVFTLFGIYTKASAVVAFTLNSIFAALTCVPIYHIGRRTLGAGVGLGAAWAWAFYFWSIHVAVEWIWDSSLFVLLVTLVVAWALQIPDEERISRWIGFALLCGFTVMVNTTLAATLPFLGLWICWRRRRRPGWLVPVSMATIVFLASQAPWFIRNYVVFGQVVFPRSNLGLELYLGNIPNAENDIFASLLHPSVNADELSQFQQMGELGYMAEKKRQALTAIEADPGEFVRRCTVRMVEWWFGSWQWVWKNWHEGRPAIGRRLLITFVVGALGLAGLLLAWRDGRPVPVYAVVLLSFPLVHYVTQVNPRYRLAVEPLLILLAVYAVARLALRYKGAAARA